MGKREKSRKKQAARPKTGVMDVVLSGVAVVLVAGLRSFAGPCAQVDATVHVCGLAGHVLLGLGFGALALALLRLFAADLATRRSFDLLLLIVGVLVAVLPGISLALCAEQAMHCRHVMLPFARVMGGALGLAAVACEATVDHEVPTGRKRRR